MVMSKSGGEPVVTAPLADIILQKKRATLRGTARIFGMSEYSLRQRLRKDKRLLPGVYSGNRYLVDLDKFRQLLEQEEGCGQD